MSELKIEADPAEVGLDADRLERIGLDFRAYVDDGRLPGWLITVSRRGRRAYVTAHGSRDLEAGRPVETDTLWRIYSMTKPITSVAAMMLYEEGRFELDRPGQLVHPLVPRRPGVRRRVRPQGRHGPRHRAGPDLAPASARGPGQRCWTEDGS